MYRIRKTEKGYLTEKQVNLYFGGKWVHYLHYHGLPKDPFYFETYESALENIKNKVEFETIINSNKIRTL